jgi:ABC-2 type transport system permease protein
MNAVKLNKALLRREFWENRSLWIVPTAVIGVLTVLSIYMLFAVIINHSGAVNNVDVNGEHFQLDNLPDFADADPAYVIGVLRCVPLLLAAFLFNPLMQIVTFFYLLDSLYADRRDRSVLFWRSMPVSDSRSVLVKLATAVLTSTVITFLAVVAFELILLVLEQILGGVLGVHPWVMLLHPWAFISGWLLLAYGLLAQALWVLPYYGWLLLASSWARKTPFLWAVLPPLGVIVAEGWVFHTTHFAHLAFGHKYDWLPLAYNIDPTGMVHQGKELLLNTNLVDAGSVARFIGSPELWIGSVIAAGFVYGAIWLRRNRNEI